MLRAAPQRARVSSRSAAGRSAAVRVTCAGKQTTAWEARLEELKSYHAQHGTFRVPAANTELTYWVEEQRKAKRGGRLSADREAKLNAIGFPWGANDKK
jgi:hypothetical protein